MTFNLDSLAPSPVSMSEEIERVEAKSGQKVVRFDLAEPHFQPPQAAIDATIEAIREGKYKYSSSWGIKELRQEVANYLSETRGAKYSADNVLVTTGGKFANYAFFASMLRRGDSVLLVKPYWTSFRAVPDMLGLRIIESWSKPPFRLDREQIKDAVTQRPKAVVLNSPNNPTGGIITNDDLKFIGDLAEEYRFHVLSDEIDWPFVHGDVPFTSASTIAPLKDAAVVTDGVSKAFGMTGWRVGFAAGPSKAIKRMHAVQEHCVSAPATFAQYGAMSALRGWREHVGGMLIECRENLAITLQALRKVDVLDCPTPEGGFYVYPSLKGRKYGSSIEFTKELLENGGVAVIPGTYFGDDRLRFRLCYAVPKNQLLQGLERITRFLG